MPAAAFGGLSAVTPAGRSEWPNLRVSRATTRNPLLARAATGQAARTRGDDRGWNRGRRLRAPVNSPG